MSASAIGRELSITPRTVHRYRSQIRRHGDGAVEPKVEVDDFAQEPGWIVQQYRAWDEAWHRGELEPDVLNDKGRALIEGVVDAFERFFLRYSGYDELFPLHKQWVRDYYTEDRLLLNVPPRHSKSEIMTVWLTVFEVACDRNVQILIISQAQPMAKKFSNKIAYILEFHTGLLRDFGRFKPYDDATPWRPLSGEMMVEGRTRGTESGDMTVQVKGVGQQILGAEADRIRADDVVDRKSAWSADSRDKLSEFFSGDVMTRRSPHSKACVIGQCIHHEDLYAELGGKSYSRGSRQGQPVWRRILHPAILDWEKEEVLLPQLWSFDRLMETYEDLRRHGDGWLFEAMYQQNPLPASSRLVQLAWIFGDAADGGTHQGCLDIRRGLGEGMPPVEDENGKMMAGWARVISVDPSPERMTGVLVADVLGTRQDFRCGILEAIRARLDVRELVLKLEDLYQLYHPEYLIFEQNAFARWFLQDPRFVGWSQAHKVRVIGHTTGKNKSDPNYGVQTLAPYFEFSRISLPWGTADAQASSKLLIEEATNFIPGSIKAATYTDLLMALWFIYYNHASLAPQGDPDQATGRAGRGFRIPKRLEKGFRLSR